ncbi:MAG TPA: FtsX-like permease family protein, partial [Candidatus Acidoferrales bacterium]
LPVERPSDRDWSIRLMTTSDLLGTQLTTALWVLFAAVGLVLLIACANIANLLLARAAVRQRELAIRAALGAGPWRLARQSLTESLLIAFFGGLLGLVFSLWGTDFVVRFRPQALSELQRVHMDGWTLGFAFGIALLTAVVFGLAPAWRVAGRNLRQALSETGANQATGRRQNLLGRSLVTAEVALSVVLLAGAGLLVHSFVLLIQSDPGFDRRGLLVTEFSLNDQRYPDAAARTAFFQRLGESLEGIPGVDSVALTTGIPPRLGIMAAQLGIEGRELSEADRNLTLPAASVAPEFFRTAGIPILRGRAFTADDTADAAIINQGMAEHYWPGEDAVGKTFTFGRGRRTVVGVAGNVDAMGWGSSLVSRSARFQMYFPQAQWPYSFGAMAIRTRPGVSGLDAAIKARVWALDPLIPVDKIQTAEQMLAASISRQRFAMILLSIFATLAIALSAVGLYGVVSYMVEQRTREIGIRMALGARPANIFRMVLGEGAWSLVAGWGIGIALSLL